MKKYTSVFEDRLAEMRAYLDLLDSIEQATRGGVPMVGGEEGVQVTTMQKKMLYSSVYLQLYNLVESTITGCVAAVCEAAVSSGATPELLSKKILAEWARVLARTHQDMAYDKRLEAVLELCSHVIPPKPISDWSIEYGGGGNWDHPAIWRMVKRLGLTWSVSEKAMRPVLVHWKDEMDALASIKKMRNDLAHGNISFVECAQNVTASELRVLVDNVAAYLEELMLSFRTSIVSCEFLAPEARPQGGVA